MGKNYYAGIDGGSTYVKAALIDDDGVVGTMITNTGIDNSGSAERLIKDLAKSVGIERKDIK